MWPANGQAIPGTCPLFRGRGIPYAFGPESDGEGRGSRTSSLSMSHSAETPSAMKDRWIGKVVAEKFRIDGLIGEGAMGRVYRGEQLSLGKPVAIKLLHAHLGGEPRIAKRFHREARAASRLSHPNSLQIIDFGEASDGTLFIAMELLEGEDLQAIVDHDAPLSPARIGDLVVQTLRALDEAHHAGIIHRDLKPENVVVLSERSGRERVKVCDFGIAKITESDGRGTAITKDGYVCGTPEYMAPEQARGEPIDPRVDIYSAGVMLYQLLTGKVPFAADSALGVITKHVMDEPVPPREVRPEWGIPRSLERIAMRALQKRPDDRFASAAEMADAIEAAVHELAPHASERLGEGVFTADASARTTPKPPAPVPTAEARATPSSGPWMLALAGALVVLGFGAWLWLRPAEPIAPPIARTTRPPPDAPGARELAPVDPSPATAAPAAPEGIDPPVADEAPAPPEPRRAWHPRPVRTAEPNARPAATTDQAPEHEQADPLAEGRARMRAGDLTGAIARFETAARLRPSDAAPQKELGRAYMRAGDASRGIAAYRRYLRLAPSAPDRAIVERIITQNGG